MVQVEIPQEAPPAPEEPVEAPPAADGEAAAPAEGEAAPAAEGEAQAPVEPAPAPEPVFETVQQAAELGEHVLIRNNKEHEFERTDWSCLLSESVMKPILNILIQIVKFRELEISRYETIGRYQ